MLLCKKIRLEVSEQDAAALEFMQGKCRGLYNWLVMRLRNGERWRFAQEKAALHECRTYDPELNDVYGKLLAEVYFRLDKAMQAFFRRVANGETPGFPRVRPRHQFFTLCYPAMYIKINGNTVLLPTGGKSEKRKRFPTIRARLTEDVPAGYKELAITRDARGHYYASFVYSVQDVAQQPGHVVAFDLGIKTMAAGVNEQGRFYHNSTPQGGLYAATSTRKERCFFSIPKDTGLRAGSQMNTIRASPVAAVATSTICRSRSARIAVDTAGWS
jgi:putative transposase